MLFDSNSWEENDSILNICGDQLINLIIYKIYLDIRMFHEIKKWMNNQKLDLSTPN